MDISKLKLRKPGTFFTAKTLGGIVKTDSMRLGTLVLGIFFSSSVISQINMDLYSFDNCEFDSIIIFHNYSISDDTIKEQLYFDRGKKKKEVLFQNDTLISLTDYNYFSNDSCKTQVYEAQREFDANNNIIISDVDYDNYSGNEYFYENGLLKKKTDIDFEDNTKEIKQTITYEYDSLQRLKILTMEYLIQGYFVYFEPRSTDEIVSSSYEDKIIKNQNIYCYYVDSTIIEFFSEGEFVGYQIVIGNIHKPLEVKEYLVDNELIRHTVFERNSKGGIINKYFKYKTYKAFGGGEYDAIGYDSIFINYNSLGLPKSINNYFSSDLVHKQEFYYYTP